MVGERGSRWAAAGAGGAAWASSTSPRSAACAARDTAPSRGRWASAARGGGVLCLDLPARRAARKSVLTPRSAAHAFAATSGLWACRGLGVVGRTKAPEIRPGPLFVHATELSPLRLVHPAHAAARWRRRGRLVFLLLH